ncbi:MAG: SPOR domain-containing protein [Candidatus Omnitrophica bacterium]|nr:SPOR domain-containing protein [Candidatus Omnitrophota bacterium]
MGLFGNKQKRKEGFRALTEKEIQDRLYGDFTDKPHDSPPTGDSDFKIVPKGKEPLPPSGESIQSTKSLDTTKIQSEVSTNDLKEREKKKEQERLARVTEWADEEVEVIEKAKRLGWYEESKKKEPAPVLSRPTTPSVRKSSWTSLRTVLAVIVRSCLRALLAMLETLGFYVFKSKRLAYWAGGFAFLFVLFWGIHVLNVQREQAMKMPRKRLPLSPITSPQGPVIQEAESPLESPRVIETQNVLIIPPLTEEKMTEASFDRKSTPPTRSPKQGKYYVIQVATFAVESDAERLIKKFGEVGFSAFVRSLKSPSGKTYYSVFTGNFKDYSQAQDELEKFRKNQISKSFQDAFIRRLTLD